MLALKTAFRIGILPESFWNMTPNELKLCVEAANDRSMAERERDLWWAWHAAILQRMDVKHFPKLTDLIKSMRPTTVAPATGPAGADERKSMSRNLMNALLQFPTAPKPPAEPPPEPPPAANDPACAPTLVPVPSPDTPTPAADSAAESAGPKEDT